MKFIGVLSDQQLTQKEHIKVTEIKISKVQVYFMKQDLI